MEGSHAWRKLILPTSAAFNYQSSLLEMGVWNPSIHAGLLTGLILCMSGKATSAAASSLISLTACQVQGQSSLFSGLQDLSAPFSVFFVELWGRGCDTYFRFSDEHTAVQYSLPFDYLEFSITHSSLQKETSLKLRNASLTF